MKRTGTLDYETTSSYTLGVNVIDGGSPPKINSATLTVTVTNVDDNDPVCTASPYTFSVAEGSATSTAVGTVACTDADGDTFTYTHSAQVPFAIATSGAITVSGGELIDVVN